VTLDQRERDELCDLMLSLGPEAPTLCEGWTTLDLAAHLAVREREPLAGPGILIERFAGFTERRQEARAAKGLDAVVAELRTPPPFPWRVPKLRTLLNLNEYVIHHEDVRRANGMGARTDRPDLEDAVWNLVQGAGKLAARRIEGAGLAIATPDGRQATLKKGEPVATLTGRPIDLALYLAGRTSAAEVSLDGPAEAVATVRSARFGL
jgi:uncharacterized protein (TIGR03085 family)